jgi:transcription-repair coupling factor (superfamily II helicase)
MTEHKFESLTLPGSSPAVLIAQLSASKPTIVFVTDALAANNLKLELKDWLRVKTDIYVYPDYEVLPYDKMPVHPDLISERMRVLGKMPNMKSGIIICPISAVIHLTASKAELAQRFNIQSGDTLNIDQLREQLINAGYYSVSKVQNRGEFVTRGGIVDVFPMGAKYPYRIDLFDDEISSIRTFDTETQRTVETTDSIKLHSAHEFPFNAQSQTLFRKQWRELFSAESQKSPIYQAVSKSSLIAGLEYYLPLFVEQTGDFFDFVPQQAELVLLGDINAEIHKIKSDIKERYEQLSCDDANPILTPEKLFLSRDYLHNKINALQKHDASNQISSTVKPLKQDIKIEVHNRRPAVKLIDFLKNTNARICLAIDKAGRIDRIQELLRDERILLDRLDSWDDFLKSNSKLAIIQSPTRHGFIMPSEGLYLLGFADLFGGSSASTYKRKTSDSLIDILKNLEDIDNGCFLIHRDHGICQYCGLTTINTDGIDAEYVELLFADEAKVFTPVQNLNLLSRYVGIDNPGLHQLRSKSWSAAKEKARKKVYDVAAELLEIYAKREMQTAQRIKAPAEEYNAFAASFPFDETEDQDSAIADIIADLQSEHKMERLICGDVGFGKTEIAMRAAFLMVDNGFQVAVLAPTTLLVEQLYKNFTDRFADWPIKIASLSRFNSTKTNAENKQLLKSGKIDIIVGTHAILSKDIKFDNLGMLILDEEHRFGVRQKEKIKALRNNVDVLSMSATPIPRTLNLALSGVTDISIIGTPPAKRLAVRTSVIKPEKNIIREAILRETMRGGQVYIIHNDVATIEEYAAKISAIAPEAIVRVAHAQMPERQLEKIMTDFFEQRFNILVCTTIVESGIDNPIANTVLINKAYNFGLAQLHQLRGRVGRSHHQSYAYLLVPDGVTLTKEAEKRLEAICQYNDLGSGFNLASADLEIRGAGEILGQEQSGQITEIGYGMYLDMLSEAVENLKKGKKHSTTTQQTQELDIDLPLSCLLPNDWIKDVPLRLQLYHKLNNCDSIDEIEEFRAMLLDRFGAMPDAAFNLMEAKILALHAKQLNIAELRASKTHLTIKLSPQHKLDTAKIIALIQQQPKNFRLADAATISCLHQQDKNVIIAWIMALLDKLT